MTLLRIWIGLVLTLTVLLITRTEVATAATKQAEINTESVVKSLCSGSMLSVLKSLPGLSASLSLLRATLLAFSFSIQHQVYLGMNFGGSSCLNVLSPQLPGLNISESQSELEGCFDADLTGLLSAAFQGFNPSLNFEAFPMEVMTQLQGQLELCLATNLPNIDLSGLNLPTLLPEISACIQPPDPLVLLAELSGRIDAMVLQLNSISSKFTLSGTDLKFIGKLPGICSKFNAQQKKK